MKSLPVVLAVLLCAGCGGGGGGAATLPPVTSGGSSVAAVVAPTPAPTPVVYAALGDSITAGGTYPQLVATALGATLTNLGVGGEFSGPTNITVPGPLNLVYGGVVADEVPQIPTNANLVSLFIGTNDMWASQVMVPEPIDASAATYVTNLASIITAVHHRVPSARLLIASVTNPAYSYNQAGTPEVRASITRFADLIKSSIIASGETLVDIECEPVLYQASSYDPGSGLHPNAIGHAAIAADFLAAYRGARSGDCSYAH